VDDEGTPDWYDSPAAAAMDAKVGGNLFKSENSAYSLGWDFVNLFNTTSYSIGLVVMRCEDMALEFKSKRRRVMPVLIVPGGTMPASVDGYFRFIAKQFKALGDVGVEVTAAEHTAHDGTAHPAATFVHRAYLCYVIADTMARIKLSKNMASAGAYLACQFCWMTGVYCTASGPVPQGGATKNATMCFCGYSDPVPGTRGRRAGVAMSVGNTQEAKEGRFVTLEEQVTREIVGAGASKELHAFVACSGKCVLLEELPYLHPFDMYVLPFYHAAILGVGKDFLRMVTGANAKAGEPTSPYVISSAAKTKIAALERFIMLNGDFGRRLAPLRLCNSWTIEETVRFIEVYSMTLFNDTVVGTRVLHPRMKKAWGCFRRFIMHHMRPYITNELPHSKAARDTAANELLQYGKIMEDLVRLTFHTALHATHANTTLR
jgi:hypothetical protein